MCYIRSVCDCDFEIGVVKFTTKKKEGCIYAASQMQILRR